MPDSSLLPSTRSNPLKPPTPPPILPAKQLASSGTRLYDPGYAHTLSCKSSITLIDGHNGILRHRGYPIEQLASSVSFLELAYLLLYSHLPTKQQLRTWQSALYNHQLPHDVKRIIQAFPPDSHPMAILQASLVALGTSMPHLNPVLHGDDVYRGKGREEAIQIVLGLMPRIVAAIWRRCQQKVPTFVDVHVKPDECYAAYMLKFAGIQLDSSLIQTLELLLILHADHEQNCSTSTVRNLSSSGVDVFSCLVGGVAALYGPLHGGATEAVLNMLNEIANEHAIDSFLHQVKARKRKLMGFGHRVYRNYDPRAAIIRQRVHQVLQRDHPLLNLAAQLERTALQDHYFVSRRLFPNCDFYSGVLYSAMGFHPSFFPVLFALARSSGWMAHWNEFLDDPDRRIARPHQHYIGKVGPIDVPPIHQRQQQQQQSHIPTPKL